MRPADQARGPNRPNGEVRVGSMAGTEWVSEIRVRAP